MAEFNKNMLSPLGFSFHIKKLPEFNHFCQSVTMPGPELGYTERATPFKTIPVYGDHLVYGELTAEFKVNEDLGNYIEIYNWLQGVGFPDDFQQFKDISRPDAKLEGSGVESDAYIMVLSSNMQPIVRIDIQDMFPVGLSELRWDSRDSGVEYIEAQVRFIICYTHCNEYKSA
jgi:hypothetical protein